MLQLVGIADSDQAAVSIPQLLKTKTMIRSFAVVLLALSAFGSSRHACAQHNENALPDAPQPQSTEQQQSGEQQPADPKAASPVAHASYETRKWSPTIEPGERVPPLRAKDKMVYWLHEQARPTALLPAFVSAGYGQLVDSDPHYGTDSAAFGERLGAAALRDASMRFFADSLLPTLVHEDPRYYRKASGSYGSRGWHAVQRVVVDESDHGHQRLDVSDIFGRLIASGLTLTYYPHRSTNGGAVVRTWGTSIVGAAGDNLFLEFWPDILNRFHHEKTP
jgi:hypothetical protein